MLKHSPRVYLKFVLPSGNTREGWFTPSTKLVDIMTGFGVKGTAELNKRALDQEGDLKQLELRNDDIIIIK